LGNTPQYFKWYINSSSLLQAGTSSVYNVTSSRKNPNSGIYTCQVTNSYGTATSPNFQVQVLDPVELVSETPPDSTPSVNSMVYFIVSATGDLIRYRWKKRGTTPALDVYVVDGQPSILNEGYQSSTLSIQAISPASEGSYFCEISNSISNTSSSNMLIYVTAPTIVTQPSDVDSFGVSSVVATGSAISYSWEYNGVPITDQTSSSLNLSVAVNENNFTQTMMDQLSTLKCKVYNQVGYNYSNTIQVKPFKNSSAASPTGGGAATRCDNSFNAINATVQLVAPIGTTYTVYKNGTNVGSDLTEFGETMPKLTLHNVQFSDAGTYCVSASFNGKSVVSDSTTVTVAVNNVSHNVPNPVKYVFSDESHTLVADYGMSMGNLISTSPPAGNYRLDSAWRRSGVSTTYDQTTVLAEVPCPGPGGFADVPTFYAGTLDMLGGNIVGSGLTSSHAGGATYYFQYAIGVVYSSCPTNSLVNPNPWPYLPNPDTMVPTGEYGPGYPLNGTTLLQSIVMVQGPVGISTHPSGSQTRNTGSAVVFRTVGNSSGSSIHYRWYKNGTRIPESDTSTYTISNCAIADAGTYNCLVGAKSLLSYRTMLSSGSVLTVI
jgi:hypothetical protein